MAWIESHQSLREHPKLYVLMDKLNISRPQAIGHLQLFWWWCVDYASDGTLKHNDLQIARAAEWSGDSKLFVEAVIDAGFLDRTDGVLTVHDWLEFCGSLMQKRLERRTGAERRKMGAEREPTNQPNQPTVTNQPNQPKTSRPAPPSEAVRLAEKLRDRILGNFPKTKIPDDLRKWAEDVDRMLRLDSRTVPEVEQVVDWCQNDSFWRSNILSASKLREQFDRLWAKMKSQGGINGRRSPGQQVAETGKYDHLG